MAHPFTAFLAEHAPEINGYLDAFFRDQTDNASLDAYLYAPLRHFSGNAGKRHRPLICMLAAQAVGGDFRAALPAAAAIEHLQTGALIHDDIADNGQVRRDEPCLYITEGTGLAINCGDLALALVTDAVLRDNTLDDALKLRVLRELTAMTERTIEGQALDLGWVRDGRFDITVDDYLTMATLKTAHYSGAVPLTCGAIIGGGTEEQIEVLRAFGLRCGLAFQIQDDLLNLVDEAGAGNKDFRSDITEGKRTLVAVHALEHLGHAERDELVGILQEGTTDSERLSRAVELFEQAGSIAFAHAYALDLIAEAKHLLGGIELEAESRAILLAMADFFVERLN